MRPPITYYGGKISLQKYIQPLIPESKIYVEPFFGGGSTFWNYNPGPGTIVVINDINDNCINFYEIMQEKFDDLNFKIQATLHAESTFRHAREIYFNPDGHSDLTRAWAFWVVCNMSFAACPGSGFKFDRTQSRTGMGETSSMINGKKRDFPYLKRRLESVQIMKRDSINIIKTFDTKDTFFFLDPPYIGADQGHYKGYTINNFIELLMLLSKIQGMFLLCSYPSPELEDFRAKFKWHTKDIRRLNTTSQNRTKMKTECLTWNYSLSMTQRRLF
jgi:DNA adenine methylase